MKTIRRGRRIFVVELPTGCTSIALISALTATIICTCSCPCSLPFSTQIHLDFEVAVEKFKGVPYDILDVAAKQVGAPRETLCIARLSVYLKVHAFGPSVPSKAAGLAPK